MSYDRVFKEYWLSSANGSLPDTRYCSPWLSAETGKSVRSDDSHRIDLGAAASGVHLPELVIFEHIDFGGAQARTNLNWYYVGDWWNDKISSIIVVSGVWRVYEHWHYEGRYWDLTPGYYRWVGDAGIPNDLISSFQAISL